MIAQLATVTHLDSTLRHTHCVDTVTRGLKITFMVTLQRHKVESWNTKKGDAKMAHRFDVRCMYTLHCSCPHLRSNHKSPPFTHPSTASFHLVKRVTTITALTFCLKQVTVLCTYRIFYLPHEIAHHCNGQHISLFCAWGQLQILGKHCCKFGLY